MLTELVIVIPLTVALVLAYLRKVRFDRDYIALLTEVSKEGSPLVREKLRLLEWHRETQGLRRGVMGLILGSTVMLLPMLTDLVTDGFTYEKFSKKLRKNSEALLKRPGVSDVKFNVYIKDGKAALKAKVVKD